MNAGVRWSAAARARIVARIREDDARAAIQVGDELMAQTARLGRFPLLGRSGRVPASRELTISRTPCLVVYRVLEVSRVEILRILHSRQNWPPQDERGQPDP